MRLLLDVTALGSGAGGDETMLLGLIGGLAASPGEGDTFTLVAAEGAELPAVVERDARFRVERVRRRAGSGHFGYVLPRAVAAVRPVPDVVVSATHGPLFCRVPVALMVQDLSFEHRPQDYPRSTRLRLRTAVRAQVRTARVVLTVSSHARTDLIETYRLDPARVVEVPNAALPPPRFTGADLAGARSWLREQGVVGPYLLSLGNLHPRKNVARAIEAYGRAARPGSACGDHQLVVAGGRWWGSGEASAARQHTPPGSVVFLGHVDDAVREVLLRDATALVYVSLFEGFGLPPLEAMARGTPVVASDVTAIPEVVGDAGVLVDPFDVTAISDALATITGDPSLARDLASRGRQRAAAYSLDATGRSLRRAVDVAVR